jgi:Laminin B (Domain IV)
MCDTKHVLTLLRHITAVTSNALYTQVYAGIWQYAAPPAYIAALRSASAYGGRLQFSLMAASWAGAERSHRGAVVIVDTAGTRVSFVSPFDTPQTAGQRVYSSVVLREDHGWVLEPSGAQCTTAQFKAVLADAAALLIRGDMWVFSNEGSGQEVVYLAHTALFGV